MNTNIKAPKGVFDILPEDSNSDDNWKDVSKWQYLESIIKETAKDYGYREIRTPIFERTELFCRGVGETTDIVNKEMYTFEDKGGRSMTLRPEGTAAVMRCHIEKQLQNRCPVQKFYYIGPMFRYERPQAGRFRQHHQFGVEAIGNSSPEQDVEVIDIVYTLYQRLGLKNLSFRLNCVGDAESRQAYRKALMDFLSPKKNQLSKESQERFEKNPMRILDSKDVNDIKILEAVPSILDFLNPSSREHFDAVKKGLEILKIPYELDPSMVRGLDYYTDTVFEIVAGELGAQNSIGGGGRFNNLIRSLGGGDIPAVGYATGLERIIKTMIGQGVAFPEISGPECFFIALGQEAKERCSIIAKALREKHISVEQDFSGKKLKHVMRYANSIKAKFVVVIGDEELKNGMVKIKDMMAHRSYEVAIEDLEKKLTIKKSVTEHA